MGLGKCRKWAEPEPRGRGLDTGPRLRHLTLVRSRRRPWEWERSQRMEFRVCHFPKESLSSKCHPLTPPHPSIQPSIIHPSFHPSIYPFAPPRIHASSRSSLHQLLVHPFLLLFIHPTQTRTEHRRCRSILLGRSASAENRNRPTGLMGVGACVRPFLWEHSTEEATCLRDREGRRGRRHLSYLSKEGQELFRQIRRGKGVQGEDWRCERAGLS